MSEIIFGEYHVWELQSEIQNGIPAKRSWTG
jgi:hypothetical protein